MPGRACSIIGACLLVTGCKGGLPRNPAVLVKSPPITPLESGQLHSSAKVTAIGEVIAFKTVTVRSRVDGPIIQIHFQEGEEVKKGALLAVIDQDVYRTMLNEALATRDKDLTELNHAQVAYNREKILFQEGIIAKQEFENHEETFHQLEASVRADQSAVNRASLELDYTNITAPIDGRLGFKGVDVGSVVHPGDSSGIVTISQLRPIEVIFSVPPDQLNEMLRLARQKTVRVEVFSEDDKHILDVGQVLTADNAIDSTTELARIKAIFPNSQQLLWPNEFVHVTVQM
jgi:membrane fusion protein, multidrug efflux system